jgi:hypothetical protein
MLIGPGMRDAIGKRPDPLASLEVSVAPMAISVTNNNGMEWKRLTFMLDGEREVTSFCI